MSDFGTVAEELRLNRLEQKKVTTLTEKLLAEKKLDDSAGQILKAAIPEITAEVIGSNKITKANEETKKSNKKVIEKLNKDDESDIILASLLDVQLASAVATNGFYAEIFAFLRNRFDMDNAERKALDFAASKFKEMNDATIKELQSIKNQASNQLKQIKKS